MPELPEVETVVTTLRPRIRGGRVAYVRVHRPDVVDPREVELPLLLVGRTVTDVARRAKRIVITLDHCERFYVHLGMTGQLTAESPAAEVRGHTHVVIGIEREGSGFGVQGSGKRKETAPEVVEVRFRDPRRFGGVFWLGCEDAEAGLGPEPLTLRPGRFAKLLAGTKRAIKVALLDQRLVAGLGNIYADEALFLARIHPLRPANTLTADEVGRLNRAIKRTLRGAIRHRGSTLRDYVDADNEPGGYRSKHRVYDREGETCRGCRKEKIERIVLGGRSTHFCPRCQKM